MEQKYVLEYDVAISSKPERRRSEFSADNDKDALKKTEGIFQEVIKEFPFAPPPIKGTLYRYEPVCAW